MPLTSLKSFLDSSSLKELRYQNLKAKIIDPNLAEKDVRLMKKIEDVISSQEVLKPLKKMNTSVLTSQQGEKSLIKHYSSKSQIPFETGQKQLQAQQISSNSLS